MTRRIRRLAAGLTLTAAIAAGTTLTLTSSTPPDTTWGAPDTTNDTTWGTPPADGEDWVGPGTAPRDTTWG